MILACILELRTRGSPRFSSFLIGATLIVSLALGRVSTAADSPTITVIPAKVYPGGTEAVQSLSKSSRIG